MFLILALIFCMFLCFHLTQKIKNQKYNKESCPDHLWVEQWQLFLKYLQNKPSAGPNPANHGHSPNHNDKYYDVLLPWFGLKPTKSLYTFLKYFIATSLGHRFRLCAVFPKRLIQNGEITYYYPNKANVSTAGYGVGRPENYTGKINDGWSPYATEVTGKNGFQIVPLTENEIPTIMNVLKLTPNVLQIMQDRPYGWRKAPNEKHTLRRLKADKWLQERVGERGSELITEHTLRWYGQHKTSLSLNGNFLEDENFYNGTKNDWKVCGNLELQCVSLGYKIISNELNNEECNRSYWGDKLCLCFCLYLS